MPLIVRPPIDVQDLRGRISQPEDGAIVAFEGVVRNHARGRQVNYLEYHAYEAMALKKMAAIESQAKQQFAIREIVIVHRLGRLEHGECSVAIVVAAAHRAPAFEACRFAIDTLKKTVPIWKKEFYEDGSVWIEGNESGIDD